MIMNNCESYYQSGSSKLDEKEFCDLQLIRRSVCEFIKGLSLIDTSILNETLQSQYDKEASIKYGHTKAYQSFILT